MQLMIYEMIQNKMIKLTRSTKQLPSNIRKQLLISELQSSIKRILTNNKPILISKHKPPKANILLLLMLTRLSPQLPFP